MINWSNHGLDHRRDKFEKRFEPEGLVGNADNWDNKV